MERQTRDGRASPLIEVGWLVVGRLDPVDREAVETARKQVLDELRSLFPDFEWRLPRVWGKDLATSLREEPVRLLDNGVTERDARGWDFALVITGADLVSHYGPYALGVVSRSLGIAVISTVRIDPHAEEDGAGEEERRAILTQRIYVLAMHLFGHLNALGHSPEQDSLMHDIGGPSDLDRMEHLADEDLRTMEEELREVADVRLEEGSEGGGPPLLFYARAVWRVLDEIGRAVFNARPWKFPLQLSRLTAAALSSLLVLLITAETWDLGMSQSPGFILVLSAAALAGTTLFIVLRQRLLVHRGVRRLTEQAVIANVSVTAAVLLGLALTYAGLFLLVLTVGLVVYPGDLVEEWAASLDGGIVLRHYLVLAGFVASLGLVIGSLGASFEEEWAASLDGGIVLRHYLVLAGFVASLCLVIGALGASFEEQQYFRHIAYVDEET